jgi:hypothetical protein
VVTSPFRLTCRPLRVPRHLGEHVGRFEFRSNDLTVAASARVVVGSVFVSNLKFFFIISTNVFNTYRYAVEAA